MAIAKYVHKYFWDINLTKARPKDHPRFYIERILDLGDQRAFEWLKYTYGINTIRRYIGSRKISPKSQNYWRMYFEK